MKHVLVRARYSSVQGVCIR